MDMSLLLDRIKIKKWSFRYSYWFPNKNDDPLYPKIRGKSEKDKSLHEVKINQRLP